jgi:predicted TIM-barrel fold metal-dependent hydrolase
MIRVNGDKQPRSPDIFVRDTVDNGFSRGWGFHFLPSEAYWFDFHTHLAQTRSTAEIRQVLDEWFSILDGYRLARLTLLVDDTSLFAACKEAKAEDDRFCWFYFMNHHQPDLNLLDQAFACGAAGIKLHNAPIMKGQAEHKIWLGEKWRCIFERAEALRKPVLWHVTQRVSQSPYHGGSENAYWSENKKTNDDLNNEILLNDFLTVVRTYPGIPFVGAHQLHIGLDRLDALLDAHPNLYIDTSCGFFLRWADQFYETDRSKYQAFFQAYSDRILFGTDARLAPGQIDTYLVQSFLGHARFILQLHLPDDTLQAVAWRNAEKLLGLEAKQVQRRGNVRP